MKITILIASDLALNLIFASLEKRARLFTMKNNYMYMLLNVYKIKIVVLIVQLKLFKLGCRVVLGYVL